MGMHFYINKNAHLPQKLFSLCRTTILHQAQLFCKSFVNCTEKTIRYTPAYQLHADPIRYTEKPIGYTETPISYTETAIR